VRQPTILRRGIQWACVLAILTSSRAALCASPEISRAQIPLNAGWHFRQADGLTRVDAASFDDSDWTTVDIPHTWNRIGNEGTERSALSNNVQGIGWYRLHFRVPQESAQARRYFLQFDGVGEIADVWLNGHYLGKHAGAFARFRFDASEWLRPSGDNVLVVKADNSRPQRGSSTQDVIPLKGDFFVFGGIYRHVSLIVTQPVHLDLLDFGGPGLYAHASSIEGDAAAIEIVGRLANDTSRARAVQVQTMLQDAAGRLVTETSRMVDAGARITTVDAHLIVLQPHFWRGARDPYLYRVVMTVRDGKGNILDRVEQPLGLRTMTLDPNRGFLLNGESLPLRGASMHQDRPVKGWAISAADQREDFDLLGDLGGNAVRLAHYQHDQYSYDLADARGIVVWAEVPVVSEVSFDGSPASEALTANARQQLTELIRQNYNHPSIAVWSIGNEVDLTPTQVHGRSHPKALLQSLHALAKQEDPSRATTLADCCEVGLPPHAASQLGPDAHREVIVGTADSVGYNRYFGWYAGTFADFGVMLDAAHALRPALPIAVSEYGAGAALTQHSDDARGGPINPHGRPHPEEYQNLYHELSWKALKSRDYLWANFIWNLFDFSSDSRSEGDLTDINEKGLVSYDRKTLKDAFYFYRANWNSAPTLHLVGRRYVDRPYAVLDVKAYSNAATARLAINGRDLGETPCADGICLWPGVHLASGRNELRASATIGGSAIEDALIWSLSGSERVVRIKAGDISGYVAKSGERYGSDMYFDGGSAVGINPPDTAPESRIAVHADDPVLFDSAREGSFVYRIPLPDGHYRVTLRFEEAVATAAGQRLFDVTVNGRPGLSNVDVYQAAAGRLIGVTRSVDAATDQGAIELGFHARRGKAMVSAIDVTPVD
jgi:beta-galactosidase